MGSTRMPDLENRYPKDVVERMAINLYRHGDTVTAHDLIFDNPELRDELERDDLIAVEMVECVIKRNGGDS